MGRLDALVDVLRGLCYLVLYAVNVADNLGVGLSHAVHNALSGLGGGCFDVLASVCVGIHGLLRSGGDAVEGLFCNGGQGAKQGLGHIGVDLLGRGAYLAVRVRDFLGHKRIGGSNAVDHLFAGLGGGLGHAVFDFARCVLDLLIQGLNACSHRAKRVLCGGGGGVRHRRYDGFGLGFCAGALAGGTGRACYDGTAAARGCRFCLTLRPAFVAYAFAGKSILPQPISVALLLLVRPVVLVAVVTRISVFAQCLVQIVACLIQCTNSRAAKLPKLFDDGTDGIIQLKNCVPETLPAVFLVGFLRCYNHIVQVAYHNADAWGKVSGHKSGQLADVILQGGYTPVHGLALGVHGVIVAPALLACGYKSLRKKVVADGHALDFLHRFAGVICQDLIDIDARIGKLLDVDCGRFAHIGDLLQVCSHAGQFGVAAAGCGNSIAQCIDDLAGIRSIFACADEQLVCLRQGCHVKRGAGCVLLNSLHGFLRGLCAAQHIGKAGGVLFYLGVIRNAHLHKALCKAYRFCPKRGKHICKDSRFCAGCCKLACHA